MWRMRFWQKIIAADHHDAFVFVEPIQQRFGKAKKTLARQAIVFENNQPFELVEPPTDPARHPLLATQILVREIRANIAIPIDFLKYASRLGDTVNFTLTIGSWAILHDEQCLRTLMPNRLEDLPRQCWAIENAKQYGRW